MRIDQTVTTGRREHAKGTFRPPTTKISDGPLFLQAMLTQHLTHHTSLSRMNSLPDGSGTVFLLFQ